MKIGIKLQSLIPIFIYCFSAEKQGFEPWEQLPVHRISSAAGYLAVQRFSRPPQSTTLPPLQTSLSSAFVFQKRCKGTHYF